jgi:hypothetical protein
VSGCLSLTWSPVIHDLICSRNLQEHGRGSVQVGHGKQGIGKAGAS